MRVSYLITALAGQSQALGANQLLTSARATAVTSWTVVQQAAVAANIPEHLTSAAEKAKVVASETLVPAAGQAAAWVAKNPGTAATCGVAGGALVVVAAPALVAGPALAGLGFGAQGIAANSVAAGIQSGIGNAVAPSLFATLQSAGAAGYGAAVVNGVVQAGGAAVALASGGAAAINAKLQRQK